MTDEAKLSPLSETPCPSLQELAATLHTPDRAVAAHLKTCVRCRARSKALSTSEYGSIGELKTPPAVKQPAARNEPHRVRRDSKLQMGVICSVASDSRPGERLLVVVLGGAGVKDPQSDGSLTVAPISTDIQFAGPLDLIVGSDASALGYAHIVELWNYGRVSRSQLDESFGALYAAAKVQLQSLWADVRRQSRVSDANPVDAPADTEAKEETRASNGPAVVGPPVLDDADPRLGFQRDEIARAAAFYTPWVDHVLELAGPFGMDMWAADAAAPIAAEPGTAEYEVLRCVRGGGFIAPPDPTALGTVVRKLHLVVEEGTPGGDRLDEAASAWHENEAVAMSLAARGAIERTRRLVGQAVDRARGRTRDGDLRTYVETVRAVARGDTMADKNPPD